MTKPNDLFNRMGTGSSTQAAKKSIDLNAKEPSKDLKDSASIASKRPDIGHNLHKGADRSKGGGGGASSRPKV